MNPAVLKLFSDRKGKKVFFFAKKVAVEFAFRKKRSILRDMQEMLVWGRRRGGIGRRAAFRSQFFTECGFDSHRRYHSDPFRWIKMGAVQIRQRCVAGASNWHILAVDKKLRVWHNGCAPAFQAGYRGSTPLTRSIKNGGVPERPKGADCKSAGDTFDGSNPSSTTTWCSRACRVKSASPLFI